MILRILIVDDEAPARAELERLLSRIDGTLVVASLGSSSEVLPTLARLPADLVLLDIRMPGRDGLDLAAAILELDDPPHVAFVTAHDEHALEAFDHEALDYILKPPSLGRVQRLVDRTRARITRPLDVEILSRLARPQDPPILLGTRAGSTSRILVRPADVLYVETRDQLAFLVTVRGRFLATRPLRELEALLIPHRFHRVHRSWLVNLDRAVMIETDGSGTHRLHLDGDELRIPISRRLWPDLKRRLEGTPFVPPDR